MKKPNHRSLCGDAGGRLPMTWYPQSYADKVNMTDMNMRPDPATGYPGRTYRFYKGPTVFSFGDGLSYTDFSHHLVKAPKMVSLALEDGHVCRSSSSACKSIDAMEERCTNLAFDVHMRVKNVGRMSGGHTVFLFSSPPQMHNAPQKHLLGFQKVNLASQEEGMVRFSVDVCKDLSLVDENGNKKVALGEHILHNIKIGFPASFPHVLYSRFLHDVNTKLMQSLMGLDDSFENIRNQMTGHEAKECFKLHGIPDWYIKLKEQRVRPQAYVVESIPGNWVFKVMH
ncbi:hypothetical protein DH2020_045213 [Rehmannia glutinosa]|uniref:Fibronectin type III-like domain-containing protein n=1 Tax=Rehmannia glutinosa TaxID=99300 RepID=A0ABR0UES9_REHGL